MSNFYTPEQEAAAQEIADKIYANVTDGEFIDKMDDELVEFDIYFLVLTLKRIKDRIENQEQGMFIVSHLLKSFKRCANVVATAGVKH
jgi:hypothetical protein